MTLPSAIRAYMDAVAGYVEAHGSHLYVYTGEGVQKGVRVFEDEEAQTAASERLNAADEALREAMEG